MKKEEFLQKAWAAARRSSVTSGLCAAVAVAQAALESNWGKSELSRKANNYFGLKAHGSHPCVAMPTRECDSRGEHTTRARFAVYESMEECFADRDRVIATCGVYAKARDCAADVPKFITELAKHWATDPDYAMKLMNLVEQVSRTEGR